MATKNNDTTTIAVNAQVKAAFDEMKAKMGSASQNEALAALLESYDADAMTGAFDDIEVAGVKEVKRILTQTARQMVMILSHRHDVEAEAIEAGTKRVEELTATLAERDVTIDEQAKAIEANEATIAELTAKANSVDALAEQVKAQAERIDKMGDRFDKQVERYESELDEAKGKVEQMTAERDAAQAKVSKVEAECDALKAEVERLTAELDQAKAAQSQN